MESDRNHIILALVIMISILGCISAPQPETTTTTVNEVTISVPPHPPEPKLDPKKVDEMKDALTTQDPDKCAKMEGSFKDACYREVAISKNDVNLCEKIASSSAKQICYLRIATNTKDKALCDKIQKADIKAECIKKTG